MNFSWLIQGLEQLLAGFVKSETTAQMGLRAHLYKMGDDIMADSLKLVPRDTGRLAASAFIDKNGDTIDMGYEAEYAMIVHELPPDRARHAPPTQYKFLEIPARQHYDRADEALKDLDPFAGVAWWNG